MKNICTMDNLKPKKLFNKQMGRIYYIFTNTQTCYTRTIGLCLTNKNKTKYICVYKNLM